MRVAPSPASVRRLLSDAGDALLDERRFLTADELARLADVPDRSVPALAALAHEVRLAHSGPTVEIEGILSAKTGGCPEDCSFCSQSSRYETPVKATPFLDTDEVLLAAEETARLGASEFCIVLAVRGPDERTMARILELVPLVRERTGLQVAVSAGILTEDQATRLAAGGVHRYNHNLETARSFFPHIATTHSWDERFETCRLVRAAGMQLCCGALLGMGETVEQPGAAEPAPGGRSGRGAGQLPQPPPGHAPRRPPPCWGRSRRCAGSRSSGWRFPASSCATPVGGRSRSGTSRPWA